MWKPITIGQCTHACIFYLHIHITTITLINALWYMPYAKYLYHYISLLLMSMSPFFVWMLLATGHALKLALCMYIVYPFGRCSYTWWYYRHFKNDLHDQWCSHNLFLHGCCKVRGSGPELFHLTLIIWCSIVGSKQPHCIIPKQHQ